MADKSAKGCTKVAVISQLCRHLLNSHYVQKSLWWVLQRAQRHHHCSLCTGVKAEVSGIYEIAHQGGKQAGKNYVFRT